MTSQGTPAVPAAVEASSPAGETLLLVCWLGGHALLGGLAEAMPYVSTAHGVVVACIALLVGAVGSLRRVASVVVYVGTSQVLWRMTDAQLPYMLGMYLVVASVTAAALRRRIAPPPVVFAFLIPLLPSAILTLLSVGSLDRVRKLIAFNLAGPLALFAVLWLFSRPRQLLPVWHLIGVAVGPILATSVDALWYSSRLEQIRYTTQSNFDLSGGFGPNQVASVFSIGLVFLVGFLLHGTAKNWRPLVWALLAAWAVQMLLTFSRGGAAMALGSVGVMAVFLVKRRGRRAAVFGFAAVAAAVSILVLVPGLNSLTNETFSARYTDPNLSGRSVIAQTDLEILFRHPVLGAGPGMSTEIREATLGTRIAPHTEFTRLLAEHGMLGIVSLAALGWIAWSIVSRASRGFPRAWAAGMMSWAILYMGVDAFRTALPAVAVLLALAAIPLPAPRGRVPAAARGRPEFRWPSPGSTSWGS